MSFRSWAGTFSSVDEKSFGDASCLSGFWNLEFSIGDAALLRSALNEVVLLCADKRRFPPLDRRFINPIPDSATFEPCGFVVLLY